MGGGGGDLAGDGDGVCGEVVHPEALEVVDLPHTHSHSHSRPRLHATRIRHRCVTRIRRRLNPMPPPHSPPASFSPPPPPCHPHNDSPPRDPLYQPPPPDILHTPSRPASATKTSAALSSPTAPSRLAPRNVAWPSHSRHRRVPRLDAAAAGGGGPRGRGRGCPSWPSSRTASPACAPSRR